MNIAIVLIITRIFGSYLEIGKFMNYATKFYGFKYHNILAYLCTSHFLSYLSFEMSKSFYVVWVGKFPGIYTTWGDCESQIKGVSGSQYKKYSSFDAAMLAIRSSPPHAPWVKPPSWPFALPQNMHSHAPTPSNENVASSSSQNMAENPVKVVLEGKKITIEGNAKDVCHVVNNLK